MLLSKNCPSNSTSKTYNSKHHSMVNFNAPIVNSTLQVPSINHESETEASLSKLNTSSFDVLATSASTNANNFVLLAAALVEITDTRGTYDTVPALIDCASQAGFLTQLCFSKLGLIKSKVPVSFKGINLRSFLYNNMYYTSCRTIRAYV